MADLSTINRVIEENLRGYYKYYLGHRILRVQPSPYGIVVYAEVDICREVWLFGSSCFSTGSIRVRITLSHDGRSLIGFEELH